MDALRAAYRPTMALLSEAMRVRDFNQALGTNVVSLRDYPADYVDAVIAWVRAKGDGE